MMRTMGSKAVLHSEEDLKTCINLQTCIVLMGNTKGICQTFGITLVGQELDPWGWGSCQWDKILSHKGGDDHAGWTRTCTVRVVKFSLSTRKCNTLGVDK